MARMPCGILWLASLVLLVATVACGGGGGGNNNGTPTSPTPPPPSNTGGTTGGTTITIERGGVPNPSTLTVPQGTRVTFVNNDTAVHDIQDDPHPTHGDCPDIQQVGFLTPNQTRQTGNLNVVRTCGWHDHNNPTVNGRIVVQAQ